MSATERRARERAQRHQLIVTAARELAEADGWEAVTTRRLAQRVEYSQPVLYGHFSGRNAIVGAVAIEGFGELTTQLQRARLSTSEPSAALREVARAYLGFAAEHVALYQAMFVLPTDIEFGNERTPPAARAAFDEFVAVLGATRADRAWRHLHAEVVWSALHGMVLLSQTGRIPLEHGERRLDVLLARIDPTT